MFFKSLKCAMSYKNFICFIFYVLSHFVSSQNFKENGCGSWENLVTNDYIVRHTQTSSYFACEVLANCSVETCIGRPSYFRLEIQMLSCEEPVMIEFKILSNISLSPVSKEVNLFENNITDKMEFKLPFNVASILSNLSNSSFMEHLLNTSNLNVEINSSQRNENKTKNINPANQQILLSPAPIIIRANIDYFNKTHFFLTLKSVHNNEPDLLKLLVPAINCKLGNLSMKTQSKLSSNKPTIFTTAEINGTLVLGPPFCHLNRSDGGCGPHQVCVQFNVTHPSGQSSTLSNVTGVCRCSNGYVRLKHPTGPEHPIALGLECVNVNGPTLSPTLNNDTAAIPAPSKNVASHQSGKKSIVAITVVVSIALSIVFALSAFAFLSTLKNRRGRGRGPRGVDRLSRTQSKDHHGFEGTSPRAHDPYHMASDSIIYADVMHTLSKRFRKRLRAMGIIKSCKPAPEPFKSYGHGLNGGVRSLWDNKGRPDSSNSIHYTPLDDCNDNDADTCCALADDQLATSVQPTVAKGDELTTIPLHDHNNKKSHKSQFGLRKDDVVADESLLDLSADHGDLLVSFK